MLGEGLLKVGGRKGLVTDGPCSEWGINATRRSAGEAAPHHRRDCSVPQFPRL